MVGVVAGASNTVSSLLIGRLMILVLLSSLSSSESSNQCAVAKFCPQVCNRFAAVGWIKRSFIMLLLTGHRRSLFIFNGGGIRTQKTYFCRSRIFRLLFCCESDQSLSLIEVMRQEEEIITDARKFLQPRLLLAANSSDRKFLT